MMRRTIDYWLFIIHNILNRRMFIKIGAVATVTTAVGSGYFLSNGYQNSYYVGCDYLPAGNYIGQEVNNVSPPTS